MCAARVASGVESVASRRHFNIPAVALVRVRFTSVLFAAVGRVALGYQSPESDPGILLVTLVRTNA